MTDMHEAKMNRDVDTSSAIEGGAAIDPVWSTKTDAELVTATRFIAHKEREELHVVGVVGFSGQWSEEKIASDPELRFKVKHARHQLEETLTELKERHGEKLVVSSGATMEGVPKLVYEVCEELGIKAMGVACEKAIDYRLGEMRYLLIEGSNWGDESLTFLRTSDELFMIGGGGQAKREVLAAASEGKKVTIFKNFGGTADELTGFDIKGATFVMS